ncbi:hypothetical protein ANCCAN_01749 [Ancylostoma caninum]|uniref:Uncharacterized protein n=1 Tax=Ancylostoma caninum TaxID=29170 RepID=A0A368H5U1_ANCCA|nr:hypothetical protein ANCCAN_01749 [Ancylostoma caninum]
MSSTIIPVVVASNIIFTIFFTLHVPVAFVHNYCIVVVASGPISSGKTGLAFLVEANTVLFIPLRSGCLLLLV